MTSEQVRAARALLRWEQKDLAAASGMSLPAIKRLETIPGPLAAQSRTIDAIRAALEVGGIEFIAENGGGPGVRLKSAKAKDKSKMGYDQNYEDGFRQALRKHGFRLKRDYRKDTYTIFKGEHVRGGGTLEKDVAEFIASLEKQI